jgi:tRNA-dihydrouridine synthase 3
MSEQLSNPADPEQSLKRPIGQVDEQFHTPQPIFTEDSAVTKAEKVEINGVTYNSDGHAPAAKRAKMEDRVEGVAINGAEEKKVDSRDKVKGIALVKTESVSCAPCNNHY